MGRNIAKSSFAVEQDRRDYTILLALKRGNDARGTRYACVRGHFEIL